MYFSCSKSLVPFCSAFIAFWMYVWGGSLQADWSEAQIDSIRNSLTSVQDTQLVNSYVRLASSRLVSDEDALNYAQLGVDLADSIGYDDGQIKLTYLLGHLAHHFRKYQSAVELYKEGISLAKDAGTEGEILRGYRYIVNPLYQLNQMDSCLIYNGLYREQAAEIGDSLAIASSHTRDANYYFQKSLTELSLESFISASRILERLRDTTELIRSYGNIAMVLERKDEDKDATTYYRKALQLGYQSGKYLEMVPVLLNMSILFKKQHLLDSTEYNLTLVQEIIDKNLSLDHISKHDYQDYQIVLHINQAALKVEQAKYEKALSIANTLLQEEAVIGNKYFHANVQQVLAEANLGLQRYSAAHEQAVKARDFMQELSIEDDMLQVMELLVEIEVGRANFEAAFEYQKAFLAVKDSLSKAERKEVYQALMVEYETEKREREINELRQQQLVNENSRNLLLAAIVGISIVALLIIVFLRFRARKNRELFEQSREVDRMKSRFFTQISHELRTPLTLIHGPLEQLREQESSPEMKAKVDLMYEGTNRLLQLVNKVMDLSKVQAGKLELQAAPVLLTPLMDSIFSFFSSRSEEKEVDYQLLVPTQEIELYLDEDKFHQIMSNLISNGLKFTPKGGQLQIQVKDLETKVLIEVRDNGPGISQVQKEHIFNPYFQGTEAEKTKEAGTGIGLALTKELVELQGGSISVESEIGKGSNFILYFPKGKDHLTNDQLNYFKRSALEKPAYPAEALSVSPHEAQVNTDLPLILIAEDIPAMQVYLESILKNQYRTHFASNGVEAMELAKTEMPDLIISDIMMPEMDGISFIKALKENTQTDHIPVIFLSAKSSPEDRLQGWEQQAHAFLTKPFNPRELKLIVESVLKSQEKMQLRFQGEIILRPSALTVNSTEAKFLTKLTDYLKVHMDNPELSVEELSSVMALSRSQFNRKLKALTGQTPTMFIRNFRMQRAKQLLEGGFGNVSEIADAVGISSPAYFSRVFTETFGVAPSHWSPKIKEA